MNLKLEKIFKNFTFHNIVAHPIMQILNLMTFERIGNIIHDKTIPDNLNLQDVANTEEDHPEAYRSKCNNLNNVDNTTKE